MNKERRAVIDAAIYFLEQARALIEQAHYDEQEYFDNMPNGFQESDRGQRAEEAAGQLQDALYAVEGAMDDLNNAKEAA